MNEAFVILAVQHITGVEARRVYTHVKLFPDTGLHAVVEENPYPINNGLGYIKEVEGRDELIALYGYNNQLYLFFKHQSYALDAYRSRAFFSDGLLRAVFILKQSRRKVLRIVYKHDFEDYNVLENLTKMLKPRNKKKVAETIDWKIRLYTETDPEKRDEILEWFSSIDRKDFITRVLYALEHGGPVGKALYNAIWGIFMVGLLIMAVFFLIYPICKFLYKFLGGI